MTLHDEQQNGKLKCRNDWQGLTCLILKVDELYILFIFISNIRSSSNFFELFLYVNKSVNYKVES